jgi:hypothetical protein
MAERRLFGESVMSNVVEIDSAARSAHVSANPVRDPQWGHYEPFVDEHVVASFLGIEPRRVPIGCQRKTWRFRISEIDAHFSIRSEKQGPATIGLAVLGTQERKRIG